MELSWEGGPGVGGWVGGGIESGRRGGSLTLALFASPVTSLDDRSGLVEL